MVTRFTHVSVLRGILFKLENLFHKKNKTDLRPYLNRNKI